MKLFRFDTVKYMGDSLLKIFLILFLTCFYFASQAQKHTISGYISDEATGEKLIGATIYEPAMKAGTTTNLYGFYSFTLPASDSISLLIRYVGYKSEVLNFKLNKDHALNINLSPSIELKGVEIVSEEMERIEERTQMSIIEIPISQIKAIPALFGEVDVLKSLQLLPGVQSGGEGSSGLYVRGGGPDQNLILLDGAPVYNASHLFGFFSVFNADAIKNVQLTKGGFPARYGGRLSSVIEINMKEGNIKKIRGEGSVGIIASRLTLEGPIFKDRTSFIVSGRRTYIDLLASPIIKAQTKGTGIGGYYFYDLNAKVNHKLSEKDHVYLSFYSGDDRFYVRSSNTGISNGVTTEYTDEYKLGWGNATSTFRWNHIVNQKLFSNVSLTYSKFKFYVNAFNEMDEKSATANHKQSFSLEYLSGIHDWSGKIDFDYLPNPNHYIKFGISNIYHTFNTGALQYKQTNSTSGTLDTTLGTKAIYANEMAVFIEDDIRISSRLKANLGLHYSGFSVKEKYYQSFQPRISSRYFLTEDWAVKSSYATMMQFIHLLANSNIGLPTDLWVPSTDIVKPQTSQQIALGVAKTLEYKENSYEFSVEGYYKIMRNIIDYIGGSSFIDPNSDWQKKVEAGKGWSYGTEIFLQKKTGKTSGWIGYTLSWTERQFPTINFGEKYPYKYDRRHDLSVVVSYKVKENVELAGTWVYGTGNAISLPLSRYSGYDPNIFYGGYNSDYNEIENYGSKNSFRMRAYHRFDVGLNFRKEKRWGERTISIGVYNAYNRKNPYFIYFGYDEHNNKQAKQVSLFPMIPSISYNFKF